MSATARRPSVLPHFLAGLYALCVVYAGLQPFGPWIPLVPGTKFFLLVPARYLRFDVLLNVAAYVPLGFFLALVPRRMHPWGRFAVALAVGGALSFVIETLQMYLPSRTASVLDLASNAAGACLGGSLAVMFARSARAKRVVSAARQRWFLRGQFGDIGLALVVIWLAVQVNPGIPLFATMFDPATESEVPGANPDGVVSDMASMSVEAAHSAFQLLGVGLFLALLLRERRYTVGAMLMLVGTAVMTKAGAALVMLSPAAIERWLRPGVLIGLGAGAGLLVLALWLPRAAQVAIATVALLSSLLTTLLAPELIFAPAPLRLFSWSYGQLLNFNGLTHSVLLLWPVAASAFLFFLAGRPGWGAPQP